MTAKSNITIFPKDKLQEAAEYSELFIARVVSQSKGLYKVTTLSSELSAEVSGKLRYNAVDSNDYPTVGDFVMIDHDSEKHSIAIIHYILARKSIIIRKAAGTSREVQAIAANIDTIFICMSLNNDYNLRRLERYLSVAWESGATPVIVLTKSDLCDDLSLKLDEINEISIGTDVIVTSSTSQNGSLPILPYIKPNHTVAFVGSSGVGKTTLINKLTGDDTFETKEIRKDGKGRHATTRRQLITLESGCSVIDTPGMREIGIESADLDKTFTDIIELSKKCRFQDCQHDKEPNCAVKLAIESHYLSAERLENYNKLDKELKYSSMNAKQIEKEKTKTMFSEFGGIKNARNYINSKDKDR